MTTTDIQIIPASSGSYNMVVRGSVDDSGLALLQRVIILLLVAQDDYREQTSGTLLLSFLEGGNYPEEGIMNAVLALCCADVMSQLDDDDRSRIQNLSAEFVNRVVECTLEFADGTSITGAIDV